MVQSYCREVLACQVSQREHWVHIYTYCTQILQAGGEVGLEARIARGLEGHKERIHLRSFIPFLSKLAEEGVDVKRVKYGVQFIFKVIRR